MEKEKTKTINYNFFHWGPFLYKTILMEKEIEDIKKLCSKSNKDYRENLVGLIKNEHEIENIKLFGILAPYMESYARSLYEHYPPTVPLGNKIELKQAWVNYMIKGEANSMHTHDHDLSFVLFTQVPKDLKKEYNETISKSKPGTINFIYSLSTKKYFINEHSFFPSVGDLFIFPADLHHYVNPFKCEGERISVSGNIKITNG